MGQSADNYQLFEKLEENCNGTRTAAVENDGFRSLHEKDIHSLKTHRSKLRESGTTKVLTPKKQRTELLNGKVAKYFTSFGDKTKSNAVVQCSKAVKTSTCSWHIFTVITENIHVFLS